MHVKIVRLQTTFTPRLQYGAPDISDSVSSDQCVLTLFFPEQYHISPFVWHWRTLKRFYPFHWLKNCRTTVPICMAKQRLISVAPAGVSLTDYRYYSSSTAAQSYFIIEGLDITRKLEPPQKSGHNSSRGRAPLRRTGLSDSLHRFLKNGGKKCLLKQLRPWRMCSTKVPAAIELKGRVATAKQQKSCSSHQHL